MSKFCSSSIPGRPFRQLLHPCTLLVVACVSPVNSQPTANSLHRYVLAEPPTIRIDDDGTPLRQFASVITRRLSSGDIVVGETRLSEIRLFNRQTPGGRLVARKGNGPGEMPGTFLLEVTGDTIFVFGEPSSSPSRVYSFTRTGFINSVPPGGQPTFLFEVVYRLSDGNLLIKKRGPLRRFSTPPRIGSLVPDSITYGIAAVPDPANSVKWFEPVIGRWSIAHSWPGGVLTSTYSQHIYSPSEFVVGSSDRIWKVRSDNGSVVLMNTNGEQLAVTQVSTKAPRADGALAVERRDRELTFARRALDTARANIMADRRWMPATLPHFSRAMAGVNGELWLQLFAIDETVAQKFVLVDRTGKPIAQLVIPGSLDVQQFGLDFVLGTTRNEDETISVVEYKLTRSNR